MPHREILWDYTNILVLFKLPLDIFSIYWGFLLEAIITIVVARWWFINPIIPPVFVFYSKEKCTLKPDLVFSHYFVHSLKHQYWFIAYFILGFITIIVLVFKFPQIFMYTHVRTHTLSHPHLFRHIKNTSLYW